MGGLMAQPWVLALLCFVAVASAVATVAILWERASESRRRKQVLKQLDRVVTPAAERQVSARSGRLFREGDAEAAGWYESRWARLPHLREIDVLLQQAAVSWTPQSYLTRVLGFGAGLGLFVLLLTRSLPAALIGAALGAALPYLSLTRKRTKRMRRFEEHLPEAIDLMGRAIRAGHPLSSGLRMAADEAAEPVAGELRRVFEEQRFGMPFDDSLLGLADRVPLVDTRILVTAVLIQREVGGNLAEILDKISYVVRERFMIRRQILTYTAQGRLSGMILALLPVALGFTFFLINSEYIMILFTRPVGRLAVGVALTMQVLGYLWIRKIVDIEI